MEATLCLADSSSILKASPSPAAGTKAGDVGSEAVQWMRHQMSGHNGWDLALTEMELSCHLAGLYSQEWL